MTKTDLINTLAEKGPMTKKEADRIIGLMFDSITDALAEGDKVQLTGFGTFEVRERAERKGRNPRTREDIVIPASKLPVFKAGKGLKEAVSK